MENLGGWCVDMELIQTIYDMIPHNSTIIELGSGDGSTKYLSKFYDLYSIEHDVHYINRYPNKYIYAQLIDDYWYDRNVLINQLPSKYELILVDGPIKHRRKGFVENYDIFDQNVPIILDDTHREIEKNMINILVNQFSKKIIQQKKTLTGKEFTILTN